MPDPMEPEFTGQNPIVEAASRLRARRELGKLIDESGEPAPQRKPEDAEESLRLFARNLNDGVRRLNSILGPHAVRVITLERPLRLRVRFGEKRVSLELDDVQQLVRISGMDLDGDYQFDLAAATPALINLSKISTDAGYGDALTASSLLMLIAQDAELPRPSHLDRSGPIQL